MTKRRKLRQKNTAQRLKNLERKEDMLTWITLLEALVLAVLAWRTVMG